MQLPPNPTLKSVNKITGNNKDVNFLDFFDSNKSGLYLTVRHRYHQLIYIVGDGISHLKLFTKHLKNIISAQQSSADSCLAIVEQYREEEPTFQQFGVTRNMADEASVQLPAHLSEQKTADISELHRKTDLDAFSDIWGFERNMAKLFALYWKRLNSEIYEPLQLYKKICINKLESVQEYVSAKYDKLIKSANKVREVKVNSIAIWNELCDARHALRKLRNNAPDSNKTKKQLSKVRSLETKCAKLFENVVQNVDKFNNVQTEFWDEVLRDACLQLEAIEYSRICFYQEYFDKYHELLKWRRAELENGENTLDRARKMMMTPFEITEYGIHPIRIDNGNYNPVTPQQYELPCMPTEITNLTGKITEQRIDPSIITQVFNPFGDDLKPSTSKHKKTNYSRISSVNFGFSHDRNDSTRSVSSVSIISTPSMSQIGGSGMGFVGAKSYMATQPGTNSFFVDNTKKALFARTNRPTQHSGGLPAPREPSYSSDGSTEHSGNSGTFVYHDKSPPPPNKPPNRSPKTVMARKNSANPPPNKLPPTKPPSRAPKKINKPLLPKRSPKQVPLKSRTPTGNNAGPPPKLPPRRKTMDNQPPSKPPSKSAMKVSANVRKLSGAANSKPRAFTQRSAPSKPPTDVKKKDTKKKSKWKIGK